MIKKLFLLFNLLLMPLIFFADESQDKIKYGYLIVKIDEKKDYGIFIDGMYAGKQFEKVKIPAGIRLLEIKLDDLAVSSEKLLIYENGLIVISRLKKNNETRIYAYDDKVKSGLNAKVAAGFYLFGIIFPVTNLLGFTYYGHPYARNYARPFYIVHVFFYFLPLVSYSIFYTAASIIFPVSSWYYKFDFNNTDYKIYFSVSVSFFGVSYLINLIMGIFYICYYDTYIGDSFFASRKLYFDLNYSGDKFNIFARLKI